MALEVLRHLIPVNLRVVFGSHPRSLSPEERSFQIDKVLKEFPMGNSDILLMLIGRAGDIKKSQITELAAVYEDYAKTFPGDHIPVPELARTAGITDLSQDPLLRRFCLNYERGIGGRYRLEGALKELTRGERESVSYLNPDFLTVEQWMLNDIDYLIRIDSSVTRGEVFDQTSQTAVGLFKLSQYNSQRDFWYEMLVGKYAREVFPLLDSSEIIKPASSNTYYHYPPQKPSIVRGAF